MTGHEPQLEKIYTLVEKDQLSEAEAQLDALIEHTGDVNHYITASRFCVQKNLHPFALKLLEKANATKLPLGLPKALVDMCGIHEHKGDSKAALLALERAERAANANNDHSCDISIYMNRGVILINAGRFKEAENALKKVLELNPKSGMAYYYYTQAKKISAEDEILIKNMEALAKDALTPNDRNAFLLFGLGRAYNDVGRYDEAFATIEKANRMMIHMLPDYAPKKQKIDAMIDDIIRVFHAEFFAARKNIGNLSTMPIYVLGMPRSGTTLCEQILANHPDIKGLGEQKTLGELRNNPAIQALGAYPENMSRVAPNVLQRIGNDYLLALQKMADGRPHIVDKMPYNFWHVGMAKLLFPNAKIIHITRDPLDNALSNYFIKFTEGVDWSRDFERYAHYYHCHNRLMNHWKSIFPGEIYTIAYEDLAQNLESNAKEMVRYCGIKWHESCLHFQESGGSVKSASAFQVRQKVYTSSIGRWKHYEKHLAPLKKKLGL